MPEVHELKRSLGLTPGEPLGQAFVVREVEAHREVKTPRELYNFKERRSSMVHVWVEPTGEAAVGHSLRRKRVADNTLEDAKAALVERVKENEIMYSAYGSPYHVHLSHVRASVPQGKQGKGQEEGADTWIELEALAVAKRRRDIPRLSEKHGEEAGSAEEEEAADDEMKRQGFRVVKAHFKSSHCPLCNKEFVPGEHIAKPAGDKGRGGWAHSVCLANRVHNEEEEEQEQEA